MSELTERAHQLLTTNWLRTRRQALFAAGSLGGCGLGLCFAEVAASITVTMMIAAVLALRWMDGI